MASTGFRTIIVQGEGEAIEERIAGASGIKPGHLLAISGGNAVVHATADGTSQRLVAIESPTANSATAANIDTAYTSGDTLYLYQPESGDILYMWLATANSATEGVTPLASNGDGTLKVITAGAGTLTDAIVGYAAQTLNNTSGSASRLLVRIR